MFGERHCAPARTFPKGAASTFGEVKLASVSLLKRISSRIMDTRALDHDITPDPGVAGLMKDKGGVFPAECLDLSTNSITCCG